MGGGAGVAVQLVDDVAHDGARVVAVGGDAPLGEVVEVVPVEDVEGLEVALEEVEDRAEKPDHQRQEGEEAGHIYFIF